MPCCQGSLLWAFSVGVLTVVVPTHDRMVPLDLASDFDFYRHRIVDGDFGLGAFNSSRKIAWNLYLEILYYFLWEI